MGVEYTNRRGDKYYLHEGKTKKNNPKYYFSKKKEGNLVKTIPDGYEIYENPNAQVFLRRKTSKIITDEEIAIVENGVRKYAKLNDFLIDVKKNAILVYLPNQDLNALSSIFQGLPFSNLSLAEDIFRKAQTYSPFMQFVLEDKDNRIFRVNRWCFRGSIDDWIALDTSDSLDKLVKKYCKHLGKDSFYELF